MSDACDVVVLGAGPAGAIAAATLAGRGRRVICLERAFFPRFSIGESLLPRANELLIEAGLWDAVVARNYLVKRGATFLREDGARERFRFADGLPGQPESTFQVPRADFDQTLATAAAARGADIRFGKEVTTVTIEEGVAKVAVIDVETGDASQIEARFVIDASGPARVLPKQLGLVRDHGIASRVALFCMVEGDARPPGDTEGDIWVCLHPSGAWLWVIPFSDGRTSVGAVAESSIFEAISGSDREKLLTLIATDPNASARLANARPVTRTTRLGGWSTSVTSLFGDGWALAGNTGEFLDPVFSSGVTLALESGSLAGKLVDRQLAGEVVDWAVEFEAVQRRAVGVFRAWVSRWYTGDVPRIFFARRKVEDTKRYVTSVLAGHVLDPRNPLVRDPEAALKRLALAVSRDPSSALRRACAPSLSYAPPLPCIAPFPSLRLSRFSPPPRARAETRWTTGKPAASSREGMQPRPLRQTFALPR